MNIYRLANYLIQFDFEGKPLFAMGHVYGNPKFKDGTSVQTSKIVEYVEDQYIKTLNSTYLLEK